MLRLLILAGVVGLALVGPVRAQKEEKKLLPAELAQLLKSSPAEFLKRFDKNGDDALSKDELPPFFARGFEKADADGNGKLDRKEIQGMLQAMRGFALPGAPGGGDPERVAEKILEQLDANKDGKIARAEAKGRLADTFDQVDTNKDGFIDRAELRVLAQRIVAQQGGPPDGKQRPDFDALDRNADGRLSREELRGTPFAERFADIDADGSGAIDRREFERFLKAQASK